MDRIYRSASKKKVCCRLGSQKGWLHTNYNGIDFVLGANFRSDLGKLIRKCICDVQTVTSESSVL